LSGQRTIQQAALANTQISVAQPHPVQLTHQYVTRVVNGVLAADWDSWLAQSPGGGHILQSYAFGEFKRTVRWKPERLVLERGGVVMGLGQFLVYKTPLVPGTLMYCPKGPWLPWDDDEALRVFFAGVQQVARRQRAHTVKIEPEVREQQAAVKAQLLALGFRKGRYDLQFKSTMLVNLTPAEDVLLGRMKDKTRYNIRLAGRKGVTVVEENSLAAREAFFRLLPGHRRARRLRPAALDVLPGDVAADVRRRPGAPLLRYARGATASRHPDLHLRHEVLVHGGRLRQREAAT